MVNKQVNAFGGRMYEHCTVKGTLGSDFRKLSAQTDAAPDAMTFEKTQIKPLQFIEPLQELSPLISDKRYIKIPSAMSEIWIQVTYAKALLKMNRHMIGIKTIPVCA